MRKTPLKRRSRTPEARLKAQLWELCKQIVRKKYAKGGIWTCFTCGKTISEAPKAHTGHFIPSASCGAYLRYDLRNLRIQCYFCNINLGGNGATFYRNLVQELGQEDVDRIFRDKERITKANAAFYQEKIEEYTAILETLS